MHVPAEELPVTPQLPFGGDVSPSTRCEAASLFAPVGTKARGEASRRSKAAPEETAPAA